MNDYVNDMKRKAETSKPREQKIFVAIAQESWLYSVGRDMTTLAMYFAAFALNKYTLDSSGLGFVIGFFCFAMTASKLANAWKKRVVRGKTVDDVCNNLADRLRSENFE
jgi:hypothetical protein